MRELKFRAYHFGAGYSVRPEMLYDENLGDVLKWKRDGQDLSEVMQYTGLKDKNGREIFEGDILRVVNNTCHITPDVFLVNDIIKYDEMITISNLSQYEEIDVIGNIHENPELLGETQ